MENIILLIFFVVDLAQIRALVESTGMMGGGAICPSCEMPFDKGKKRRLIDSCGHERCYSCLFRSEACPVCKYEAPERQCRDDTGHYDTGFSSSEPVSIVAINEWNDDASTINSLCGSPLPRPKFAGRCSVVPNTHVSTCEF